MRRASFLFLAALTAALVLSGCYTRIKKVEPTGDSPVTLKANSKRTEHTAKLGHRVTITLPVDRPAHVWTISYHDMRYLQQLTEITPLKNGSSGATVSFVTARPGKTRLRFVLVPANAGREVTPIDAHDLELTIE
jgi:hypothetical protein